METERNFICSLIRINDFDKKGNYSITQGVPLLETEFDSIREAINFGERHIGKKMVWEKFWGKENNNEDLIQIIVGYKVYDENDSDKEGFYFKMCNPSIISNLWELYKQGGERKMRNEF